MFPKANTTIFIYIFLFVLSVSVYPQGSWTPAGADFTYPRTLLKNSRIADVRNSLSNAGIMDLYAAIYENANASIPSGSTDLERLAKSHIAKDAAFVILMNKKYVGGVITDLTPSESTALQNKILPLLQSFEVDITAYPSYDAWQWRSKELIDYTSAYDLLKGAGISDATLTTAKSHIQTYAGNLYQASTVNVYLTYNFFNMVLNNHALMTASAIGFAAVVLNDATSADANYQPINWIGAAMVNIENVMYLDPKRQSEPNVLAGYYEGPGYFRYAFLNCLPFFRAMGNFLPEGTISYTYKTTVRSIENPFFDQRYTFLYDWVAKTRMPDGRLVASEDTYVTECFPELALLNNSKYNWTNAYEKFGSSLLTQLRNSKTELWANYISALPSIGSTYENLFQALPLSGDLVFRSSFESSGTYMHVTAKNGLARANSFGHNQADVSSFIIYNNGEILALDPGYINYNNRSMVGTADEHNMILVDGSGPAIGSPSNSNDADGYIENTFTTPNLGYGEARTNYLSVDISRKFLFVRNKYYIDADFISGAASHNYTYQLHGHGLEGFLASDSGSFTDNLGSGEGVWSKGSESLLAHITANGGVTNFSKVTKLQEVDAGIPGTHTVVYANKNGVQNTEYLAALYPYGSSPATITTLNGSPFTAIKVVDGIYTDLSFTQEGTSSQSLSSSISGITDDLNSDASVTLYSTKNSAFNQAFIKNGTDLKFASTDLILSNTRMDISIQKVDTSTFAGYASTAGTITIYTYYPVTSVTGLNITTYTIPYAGFVQITFSGASNFNISLLIPAGVKGSNILKNYILEQNYPNPFNPSTVIKYTIPFESNVKLKIYNELGEEVKDLVSEIKSAGVYQLSFNAGGLSSGVYYYTIKANSIDGKENFQSTKKMVILH